MTEGWLNFDYVILFSQSERISYSRQYKISHYLPGFTLAGIYDWNYFLVTDVEGKMYSLPCLPLDVNSIKAFELPADYTLEADERYLGLVRWYLKPEIAGGNPRDGRNLVWISLELHADLVAWWNEKLAKKQTENYSDFGTASELLKVA